MSWWLWRWPVYVEGSNLEVVGWALSNRAWPVQGKRVLGLWRPVYAKWNPTCGPARCSVAGEKVKKCHSIEIRKYSPQLWVVSFWGIGAWGNVEWPALRKPSLYILHSHFGTICYIWLKVPIYAETGRKDTDWLILNLTCFIRCWILNVHASPTYNTSYWGVIKSCAAGSPIILVELKKESFTGYKTTGHFTSKLWANALDRTSLDCES